jgi:hypothetical protein
MDKSLRLGRVKRHKLKSAMDSFDDRQTSYRSRTDRERSLASMGIARPFQPVLGPEVCTKPENVSSISGSMSTRMWSIRRGTKGCHRLCERRKLGLRRPW